MNKAAILGFLRHVLTYGGGFLTSKGIVDASSAESLVGGAVAVAGLVWSVIEKRKP